ncbi:sortase [Paenibacillus sp. J23TS9]|uniref:class D sortase n=1 Tax=Paenibacillus sp. J23TS9 TaxID=2807193 RepID=UPI001B245555|nr:class D sortase [Paenibacillus sp. J23TS9]GIP30172.1 sortase [Paenibacillus sp. J23TS9]
MKFKIGALMLIITGIVLLCYPKVTELRENAQQQRLAKTWETSFRNVESPEESTEPKNAVKGASTQPNVKPLAAAASRTEGQVEGMLEIDKIGLKLPILHGATKQNMKTTLASIEHTGTAGEIGNYAIAGHRNRTYGRNFNRLDELQTGDTIEVDTGERRFEYTVTEKLIVKPEDVWVLESDGKDEEITLVTCHPMVNPTHRLIIKGKIIH